MSKSTFEGSVKASASQTNPLQTNLEFIFTDFLPNANKQGVNRDEASNIIRTGKYQPVKVDFRRGKIGDHAYSVPVGPIIDLELRDDKIIGRAIIWKDEFGELTDHLEKASAAVDGVHFSWELYHDSKDVDDAGISWLNNCVVAGATIVANPAYSGRTPLLAYAAEDMTNQVNELERKVASLSEQLLSHSGSTISMEKLEELEQLITGLTARVDALIDAQKPAESEAAIVDSGTEQLTAELAELRTYKETTEAEKAKAAVLVTRRAALKDVLADAEFETKADFIVGLSDDQFKSYAETITTVLAKTKSTSSDRTQRQSLPDPLGEQHQPIKMSELGKALREHK